MAHTFYIDDTPLYQIVVVYAFFMGILLFGVTLLYATVIAVRARLTTRKCIIAGFSGAAAVLFGGYSIFCLATISGFGVIRADDHAVLLHPRSLAPSSRLLWSEISGVHLAEMKTRRLNSYAIWITDKNGSIYKSTWAYGPIHIERLQNIISKLREIQELALQ